MLFWIPCFSYKKDKGISRDDQRRFWITTINETSVKIKWVIFNQEAISYDIEPILLKVVPKSVLSNIFVKHNPPKAVSNEMKRKRISYFNKAEAILVDKVLDMYSSINF